MQFGRSARPTSSRIGLFLPSLEGGGAERVMLTLAGELANRGFEVDFLLSEARGPLVEQVPENVRLIDLKRPRVMACLPALVSYLRRERPRVLVSGLNHANLVVLWASSIAGVPTSIVVTVHNTLSRLTGGAHSFTDRALPALIRRFYGWSDAIVAVSGGVADDLAATARLPRESIRVIYNPVVTDELFARADQPADHPWMENGGGPVVLGVGALTRQKDFPTLIRAFAGVERPADARLMILGEGPDRPELERLIGELGLGDRVALPGFVGNALALMARSDVFVLSSLYEGLPTVLIEASAVGVPVISTDCKSGPREILDGGRYGKLVPVGDVEALSGAISAVLADPAAHRVPAERVEQFSPGAVVPQYLHAMGLV